MLCGYMGIAEASLIWFLGPGHPAAGRQALLPGAGGRRYNCRNRRVFPSPGRWHSVHGPPEGAEMAAPPRTGEFPPVWWGEHWMPGRSPWEGTNHRLVLTQGSRYQLSLSHKPAKKIDVAQVTFDLYKMNPQDFIGCLNVKATLYGTYSLSYDLHCYGAKRIMKWVNWDSLGIGWVFSKERAPLCSYGPQLLRTWD